MRTFVATSKDQYTQEIILNPGTYTFQAYVKGSKFSIGFSLDDGQTWENHNLDWQVIAADFQHVKYTFTLNNRVTLFSLMNSVPSTQVEIVAPFLELGTNASTPRANEQDGMETTENLINEAIIKATFWVISASSPVIYKDSANAATAGVHTPVTIQGELKRGTTSTVGGYLTITANGDTEATTALASPRTLSPGYTAGKTLYTIRLYDKATGGVLLDTMTIPVVFKGATGIDAMNAVLSNEADVLPSSADGLTTDFTNSGTSVRVFEGSRELLYNKTVTNAGTYKVDAVGTNATPANPNYSTGGYCNYGNITAMDNDKATITFTISGFTFENVAFTLIKKQSLSKSRIGATGEDGQTSYLHIAYATNATGTTGFSVSDSIGKTYIGQYTDFTEEASADPTKYSWTLIKGDKGADAENYELAVVTESAMVERTQTSSNPLTYTDKLTISLIYKIMHTKGSAIDYVNAAAGAYHIKVKGNNGDPAYTEFSVGATPSYSLTINNYSTKTNRPTQLIVELYNNTTLIDTRIVPVVLKPDSWIEQDAQHIALINQSAQAIASLSLANGVLTQSVANLRNGVRNLIDFGDVKTTFGSATGSSAQLWDSWTKLVTLKANTTYTLTVCGCPSQGTVNAGGYMPVAVYGGTGNAFWKSVEFTSSTKEIKSVTFSTSDSGFPTDGVLTFNAYRSGGTGGSTQTCYLDWIVITEGSIPASDYFSDVETRLENGNFIVNANTIIERLLISANALVGASVFNGNYQFSQYGQDGTRNYQNFDPNHPTDSAIWNPNLVIDFLNGVITATKVNMRGTFRANLFYGGTQYTAIQEMLQSGDFYQIDFDTYPGNTYIITRNTFYTKLPWIEGSAIDGKPINGVELTLVLDAASSQGGIAQVRTYSTYEVFVLYVGTTKQIFTKIEGSGWLKVKAMTISGTNSWVILGCGGSFNTVINNVTHTFNGVTFL